MKLKPVDVVDTITEKEFRIKYLEPKIPLVIKNLATQWPAYNKWNWECLKQAAGHKKVGIYNNIKSDAFTPVNTADKFTTFGKYLDTVSKGPAEWRIFLFNVFKHAPHLTKDFNYPEHLMKGFIKRAPMLFVGGKGSITHIHFDMDMSHILHTQFIGRKKVLLFPFEEQHKLYRKPFEVLSLADFSYYHDSQKSRINHEQFPALKTAQGYDLTLEHGDTLFMPAGYWHHMEYLDSGFAMSLRTLQSSWTGRLEGAWNLLGMRYIDTVMKKTVPKHWYNWKLNKIKKNEEKILAMHKPENKNSISGSTYL